MAVGFAAFRSRNREPSKGRSGFLRKTSYALLAIVIIASSSLIYMRATNVLHEEWLADYYGSDSPNVALRGELTGVALNHEVNTATITTSSQPT